MRLYMSVREHISPVSKKVLVTEMELVLKIKKGPIPQQALATKPILFCRSNGDRPKIKLKEGREVYRYFYCLNNLKPGECLMPHFIHFNIIQIPLISLTFGFPILASIKILPPISLCVIQTCSNHGILAY